MSIEAIEASTDTMMTAELQRMFAYAGCQPTACHACDRRIQVGDTFRLIPHQGHDEMCCARCGPSQLTNRDRRVARRRRLARHGGYSRPSAIPWLKPCCENERRDMNGGCVNCGDPCL